MDPQLWNDRPYIWAILVYHFFPSPITLKMTVLHKMKMLTLAEHKNDLRSYGADLIDMNTMFDIVHNHFNQIGIKFYMC